MAYEKKPTRHVLGAAKSFASSDTMYISGPKGKRGRVKDYGVEDVTVAFTAVTTPAYMAIGTAADPDAFGDEFPLGVLAIDAGSKSVKTTYQEGSPEYEAVIFQNIWIPKDTKVAITCTAPTGGSPAGTGVPFVDIIWED